MELKYKLVGLDCANCAKKIEDKIGKLDGVKECSVVFATETIFITVNNDAQQMIDTIKKTIKEIEPDVEIVEAKTKTNKKMAHDHLHAYREGSCDNEHQDTCSCHHKEHEHHDHNHHSHDMCGCEHDHVEYKEPEVLHNAISLSIHGLDCANCAMKIETRINQLSYVEQAVVNFSVEVLQLRLKENMSQDELIKKLEKVIAEVEDGITLTSKQAIKVIEKPKLFSIKDNIDLIIGVIAYIVAIFFKETEYAMFIYLVAYLFIGYKVIFKAMKNIFKLEIFDENFLMCIATIGAFVIGDYGEAVAVMLFYSVGEIFQSYAVNKTRTSISSLMDIKSEYANVLRDGNIIKVTPEEVHVGDIVIVKVGEKVPLDGIVVEGNSTLDTSSLTGESLPRNVKVNQEVLAGVVNLTEIIKIRVTRPYEDSTVSKILELMENAASKKAPIEKFITRFAKVYTPTVVLLAVMLAVVPMFLFKDAVFNDWLYRALTFLVVSCPCALVISIPLGLYAGLGKASKVGVLVKGGNYLELLKDIDTIVFDKTGTLTYGSFEVVEINGNENLLMYGAYGEFLSNHPIGKSIVQKYNQEIDQSRIRDFKEIAGKGIQVVIDGKKVCLGNQSFMESLGLQVESPKSIGTIVHVAIDGQYEGSIVVADKIKETTIPGIKELKQSGIKNTVMLTGDHHLVANDIAKRVGIDTVYSELLPQDKVKQVESLMQDKNCKVAFVGDGINDAPVLARADIGIAMGGIGSDAAIEAADVVLMKDNIEAICDAIDISKKTNVILKQNVTFTLVIKIGVLLLTMFGFANMWMGVFADVGVTLIAILNAMRILK